ncbi:hypothetical protein, partial [Komagataeibacter kakiaceti]|uniref:hypothetical protein n=1 Tax=Komagataeibacter kakiaceti TaxID=943261 RepID=UPI00046E7BE5
MTGVLLPRQHIAGFWTHTGAGLRRMRVAAAMWLWGQHDVPVLWLPVLLAGGIALYFALAVGAGGHMG